MSCTSDKDLSLEFLDMFCAVRVVFKELLNYLMVFIFSPLEKILTQNVEKSLWL